jgi:retinol dehydrogenase 12
VNAADPGFCISQLRSQDRGFGAFMNSMLEKVLAHTTEEGSRLIVHAAVGGTDEEMRGGFVSFNNVIEPSDFAISAEAAKMQDKIHVCDLYSFFRLCLTQDLTS